VIIQSDTKDVRVVLADGRQKIKKVTVISLLYIPIIRITHI